MAPNAAPPGAALPPNKTKKRKDLHSTRSKKKKARTAFQAPALQDEDGLYIPVLTDVAKLIQVDLFLGNRVCVVHALQRLNDLFPFEEHRKTGLDMGAPNTLVASMFKFPDNEDIQTAALGCVVDLSFDEGHDQAKTFVDLGAAEATVNAMLNFSNSNSQELIRRGMGVLLNPVRFATRSKKKKARAAFRAPAPVVQDRHGLYVPDLSGLAENIRNMFLGNCVCVLHAVKHMICVIGSKQKQAITRITHRFVADMQGIKMIVTAMGRFSPDPNLCDSACRILCNIAKSKCFYPDLEKEGALEAVETAAQKNPHHEDIQEWKNDLAKKLRSPKKRSAKKRSDKKRSAKKQRLA
ncbi:expressed unknown protein [Seminavis robusta]|uniref:Uncharacterized protein n=1 Tax=Seminavis robusta TaxID=568900 RepID=A0A9N8D7B4_9STRA|nr:expressed unknown protein [Seminavis robusta]|eukprot:Sro6_g005310.1 n/a (352) ;mRNA; r:152144-153199